MATALFSFLYHLASYDTGGEALVACGMMESLLRVINWPGNELEHITFVTRAVRVIDLITNVEMQSFQNYGALNSFICRLDMEVNMCRDEQSYEIEPINDHSTQMMNDIDLFDDNNDNNDNDVNMVINDDDNNDNTTTTTTMLQDNDDMSTIAQVLKDENIKQNTTNVNTKDETTTTTIKTCLPQRAALLKSMLNFLKKAIQDSSFSDSIRHVMEGTLPGSLRHIISNAEYYGPSLFLLATDVVTVYVFQEPSLLYSLQDNGLTDVVLQALLKKDVPATREVLGSLPNVFSALCLNARGLAAFAKYAPFDKLFKVLLSPNYLSAMRRRRSSDPMGDTATNLGNAMDELMRHQPRLKTEATKAIIRLLGDLIDLGIDTKYICWRGQNKHELLTPLNVRASVIDGGASGTTTNTTTGNDSSGNNQHHLHRHHHHHHHNNNSNSNSNNNNNGIGSGNNSSNVSIDNNSIIITNSSASNTNNPNLVDNINLINTNNGGSGSGNDAGSSDEDDDDEEEEASTSSHQNHLPSDVQSSRHHDRKSLPSTSTTNNKINERTPIPLIDYIINVMKFIDAVLSNNSTDDHCREFVAQGGLKALLQILSLPNLPVDCPITASAQAVAAVCKSILVSYCVLFFLHFLIFLSVTFKPLK